MPRRIILHAGFHKTGTSTVQATLRANREALKKHVALRLHWHLKDLVAATRGYSDDHDLLTLIKAQQRFIAVMNDLPSMPRRTLILSSEELIGHMPGRGAIQTYDAASDLLYSFWEITKNRFPQAEVMIYLSTRGPDAWLASAHAEHVKSSNMTMTLAEFTTKYASAADLNDIVSEVASRVPCPVHHASLESCQDLPLGPATPLLKLCDLPLALMAELTSPPPANTRLSADTLEALRAANLAHASNPKARAKAKAAILESTQTP